MNLEGIHHITAITGDAPRNVDFYTRVLGLRLAAKTVNQDDPSVYHLFYADELGRAGSDITFFEYPGSRAGAPAPAWSTRSCGASGAAEAIDFWEQRLRAEGVATERDGAVLRFDDPEGLGHELVVDDVRRRAAVAEHPEVPAEHALQGFDAVARLQLRPGRDGGRCSSACSAPSADGEDALGAARRAPRRHYASTPRRPSAGSRARAPSTTSPSARPSPSTRAGSSASAGRRAVLADHRPPLLPLDLLPRARRRPVRDRRRRPRLHRRRPARGARVEGDPAAEARAAPRARSSRSSRRCPTRGPAWATTR